MESNYSLLIAIPTYNRSEDINYLLSKIHYLSEYKNVEISVFDSSTDDKTEKVIETYKNRSFKNLKYRRIDSRITSNEKLFLIYEESCRENTYIWILHDHTVFTKEAFLFLSNELESYADFIFLRMQGNTYSRKSYDNNESFAQKNAWLLGKMGASIVRCEKMLSDANWDYYRRKYLKKETINFSHVGFYLERICEVNDIKLIEIEFPREQFVDTRRYEKLSWEREALRICTQCWGSVILDLPEAYFNKASILSSIDQYFLTRYKLIEGRKSGYYNIIKFIRYKKWIRLVFPLLSKDALRIAFYPQQLIEKNYIEPLRKTIYEEKRKGKNVYIYGAGKHGIECMEFLCSAGIPFDGFLVSSLYGNPDKIREYNVYELNERIRNGVHIFAILSVMREIKREIEDMIKNEVERGADITWSVF